ncbi:MAG: OmpA family protein [Sphingobacteriales bacterium]|nr:MAG: OmpA family protein [Sphingobacteriales bacterium]TAF78431.1 MAG: OmpA family protein [Sphingobacteriales bacterium]
MNNKYLTFILIFILSLSNASLLYSQDKDDLQKKADKAYASFNYKDASEIYIQLAESKVYKIKNLSHLANCYVKLNNSLKAEKIYEQLRVLTQNSVEVLKPYAQVLKLNAKYSQAKQVFIDYILSSKDTASVINDLIGCDSAITWMAKPTSHIITNQNAVNTGLSNFGIFDNNNKAYFVTEATPISPKNQYKRTGNSFLKIYTASIAQDYKLNNPKIDSAIYNFEKYHTGPLITNKAGDKFYVTTNHEGSKGKKTKENKIKFKNNNLELYIFTLKAGKFKAEAFAYNNVKLYSVGQAALSSDEQTLYFTSDMPGGYGGTDIWYSSLTSDGKWDKPQNAGNQVNTHENEMFATLTADTLYFASNGHIGMGGLDIFKSVGAKNSWTAPINLKYPTNSPTDDFLYTAKQISADTIIGYFSSNRVGGKGNDDIYSHIYIKPKPPVFAVKGKILKKPTQIVLPSANLSMYADGIKMVDNVKPNVDGTYYFDLKGDADYAVVAKKERFLADSVLLSTKGLTQSKTFEVDLSLDSLFQINKVIGIANIYYDFDQDSIRSDASKILDGLVRTMLDNPTLEIELRSHTDSRANDAYNLALSQRRATSAVNYIVGRGIKASRIIAKGYGEKLLVNKCKNEVECTEEEHQANRRTDFKILKY